MAPARPEPPSSRLFPSTSSPTARQTPVSAPPTPLPSSEGPTLPIIGAPLSEHHAARSDERMTKRRRTGDIGSYTISSVEDSNFTSIDTTPAKTSADGEDAVGLKSRQARAQADMQVRDSALAPLYEPWALLPPALQAALKTRLACGGLGEVARRVAPIVFTKNQNFKAGVNRVRGALDAVMFGEGDGEEEKEQERDRVVAVSAQGEGTTKLVGIVDVARRVVEGEGEGARVWYWYMGLTSRVDDGSGRRKKNQGNGKRTDVDRADQADEAVQDPSQDDFESLEAVRNADAQEAKQKARRIPILTVWMSTSQMPAFRDLYGEEKVSVVTR